MANLGIGGITRGCVANLGLGRMLQPTGMNLDLPFLGSVLWSQVWNLQLWNRDLDSAINFLVWTFDSGTTRKRKPSEVMLEPRTHRSIDGSLSAMPGLDL